MVKDGSVNSDGWLMAGGPGHALLYYSHAIILQLGIL